MEKFVNVQDENRKSGSFSRTSNESCRTSCIFDLKELKKNKMENVNYLSYQSAPKRYDQAAVDEWLERASIIETDLREILSFTLQQFWCQVLFDDSLHNSITTFFRHAPRPHELSEETDDRILMHLKSLLRLYFLVCLRMSTHKEDKNCTIPGHEFGEFLYRRFIFDIPRMLDFCTIYGPWNKSLVEKMINNIFTQQPKYYDDIGDLAKTLPAILDSVCIKFCLSNQSDGLKTIAASKQKGLNEIPLDEFQDLILFIFDTANSLKCFLDIYPPAGRHFNYETLLPYFASFYESFTSSVSESMIKRKDLTEKLKVMFCQTRHLMIQVFRHIAFQSTLNCLFDAGLGKNPLSVEDIVENYLSLLLSLLNEKQFIADYFNFFSIHDDQDLIEQSGYKVDEMRLSYIKDAINDAKMLYAPPPINTTSTQKPPLVTDGSYTSSQLNDESLLGAVGGVGDFNSLNNEDVLLKISSIQELLPDLGSGFIKRCLQSFGGETEAVINAILEDKLPASLAGLDRNLKLESDNLPEPKIVSEVENDEPIEFPMLAQRRNIYDGDEFDVFSHDVDTTKIHIGKKIVNVNKQITDHSLKEKVKMYVEWATDDENDNYDDEYDDTYDAYEPGEVDADSSDELVVKRAFVQKPLNERIGVVEREEEDDDEETRDGGLKKNPTSFLEDPAVLRERAAQFRAAKFAARPGNWRKSSTQGHPPNVPHSGEGSGQDASNTSKFRDLKGAPKGQGQSEDVLRNRNYKEKNKATRVHHNRKNLADRKHKI